MNKAFTLIELLVVVLIIGILAAVALPQYEKAVMRSRFTQTVTAARSIVQAQQAFALANGATTRTLEDLDVVFPGSKDGTVDLPYGSCNISTYPERVVCYLRASKHKSGTAASLSWFYQDNSRLCCAYKESNFVADPLCRAEMKTDSWYQGCGPDSCHCYKEK